MSVAHRVVELEASEVDRVAHLFQELVEFHGEVIEGAWPVRRREDAGVPHCWVAVVEANAGAMRLYERAGFRPFYRNLLAEL